MQALSPNHKARVGALEARTAQLRHELGALTERYLRARAQTMTQLDTTARERDALLTALAPEYTDSAAWTYDPDAMAFRTDDEVE